MHVGALTVEIKMVDGLWSPQKPPKSLNLKKQKSLIVQLELWDEFVCMKFQLF